MTQQALPLNQSLRGEWTSASNAQADALCTGRHLAQRGIPEPEKSEDALAGSRIHAGLATGSDAGLSIDEAETFEACVSVHGKVLAQFFGANAAKVKSITEERYWCQFSDESGTYKHSGQVDRVDRYGSRALITEWKTLQGDVPASSRNLQLRDQAALLFGNVGLLDEIACVVVQPMVTHSPEICVYSRADLERATADMFERVIASNDPKAARVAGEVQCKYCLAKTTCAAYSAYSGAMLPASDVVPAVREARSRAFQTPMAEWTPEQCALVADILAPCEKTLETYKEFLKLRLRENPESIPGWTLTEGRAVEKINNPQACFDRFAAMGGTLEQFMACVTIGKTKLKESVNAVTGAKGKALDGKLKELTADILDVATSQGSLKKVGDK
jgi:hypothetical protein